MSDYDILVNKYNKLPANYVPDNLIDIPITNEFMNNEKLVSEVYKNFLLMQNVARMIGINIYITSGYRSYKEQFLLFIHYLVELGVEEATKRVANPGTSEHQTGLAIDISTIKNYKDEAITPFESELIEDIAYKYGFILRYQKGKEDITGYNYEPWHFRYVGDIAEYMYKNNLTLEEYCITKDKTLKKQL